MNQFFKDGQLNRSPRKPMPTSNFKHGKGYGYNPVVKKSPEQAKEAKK